RRRDASPGRRVHARTRWRGSSVCSGPRLSLLPICHHRTHLHSLGADCSLLQGPRSVVPRARCHRPNWSTAVYLRSCSDGPTRYGVVVSGASRLVGGSRELVVTRDPSAPSGTSPRGFHKSSGARSLLAHTMIQDYASQSFTAINASSCWPTNTGA